MVLVVADDLLFRSKISTVAKQTGVTIRAATTPDAAVAAAQQERPTLILLDLDGTRPQPFEVLRRLGSEEQLRSIPTLGFVSHVHTAAIQEARALGIGRVLARSAFVAELPDILAPHGAAESTDER